jgi:hypothetical protein
MTVEREAAAQLRAAAYLMEIGGDTPPLQFGL